MTYYIGTVTTITTRKELGINIFFWCVCFIKELSQSSFNKSTAIGCFTEIAVSNIQMELNILQPRNQKGSPFVPKQNLIQIFNVTQYIYFIPQVFRDENITKKQFVSLYNIVIYFCQNSLDNLKPFDPKGLYNKTSELFSSHLKKLTKVRER